MGILKFKIRKNVLTPGIAELVIKSGASLDARNHYNDTALIMAAKDDNYQFENC